jgi:hypothetical protein
MVLQITIEGIISLTEVLICGMEQRSSATEHHIMSLYQIHELPIKERPKYLKQLSLQDMFQKLASKQTSTGTCTSSMPEPQPSTTSASNCQDISGDIYSGDDDAM